MSWHQWSLGNVHNVNAAPTALPVLGQAAATVLPPNAQYTPEQWTQLQQQNWQQWAQWQQQYQQWQQQYGAEVGSMRSIKLCLAHLWFLSFKSP